MQNSEQKRAPDQQPGAHVCGPFVPLTYRSQLHVWGKVERRWQQRHAPAAWQRFFTGGRKVLHCFSAIHSSCLKVPASKGEEDHIFFPCASVFVWACEPRQRAQSKVNKEDPQAKECPKVCIKGHDFFPLTVMFSLYSGFEIHISISVEGKHKRKSKRDYQDTQIDLMKGWRSSERKSITVAISDQSRNDTSLVLRLSSNLLVDQ